MPRAIIVGSGSEITGSLVTNEMLSRILDTNDAWIRERSGVETRYFVNPGTSTWTDVAAGSSKDVCSASTMAISTSGSSG